MFYRILFRFGSQKKRVIPNLSRGASLSTLLGPQAGLLINHDWCVVPADRYLYFFSRTGVVHEQNLVGCRHQQDHLWRVSGSSLLISWIHLIPLSSVGLMEHTPEFSGAAPLYILFV